MKTAYFSKQVTIISGTDTPSVNLEGRTLVGVFIPTGVASTSFKLANAVNPSDTYVNAYDGLGRFGAVGDVSINIAADKFIALPPELSAGVINVKLIFNASETSKTYTIVTRGIE